MASRRRPAAARRDPPPAAHEKSPSTGEPDAAAFAKPLRSAQTRAVVGLFVGYCLYSAARRGLTVAQTRGMREELSLDIVDVGALNSAFTAAYGVSKFGGSVLCDFASESLVFSAGLVLAGAANLAMAASGSRAHSGAAWLLNGLAQGLGWPSLSMLVLGWFSPAQRGSVWSLCTVGGNVGKTISPPLLAAAAAALGWRAAFCAPGALAAAGGAAFWFAVRDAPAGVAANAPAAKAPADPAGGQRGSTRKPKPLWGALLSSADFWILAAADACVYVVLQGLSDWTPSILQSLHGLSAAAAASGLVWYEAGGIAATALSGPLSDRMGGSRNGASLLFALAMPAAIAALALVPARVPAGTGPASGDRGAWDPTTAFVSAALFCAGAGAYGPKTMCGLEARERHGYAAGAAGAAIGLVGQAGATASGLPLALLQRRGGWRAVLAGLAAAGGAAAAGFAVLVARAPRTKKAKAQ
jgi:sugar phosphate permease